MPRFFHCRIALAEPVRCQMYRQQRQQWVGRATAFNPWVDGSIRAIKSFQGTT